MRRVLCVLRTEFRRVEEGVLRVGLRFGVFKPRVVRLNEPLVLELADFRNGNRTAQPERVGPRHGRVALFRVPLVFGKAFRFRAR